MSRVAQDFTDLLLKQGVISLDQLNEAEGVAKSTSADVGDVLIQMEYATPEEVTQAMAKHHKIPYVDLRTAQNRRFSDRIGARVGGTGKQRAPL